MAGSALDNYLGTALPVSGRPLQLQAPTNHYCEPEVQALAGFPGQYQRGLVIPLYRENNRVLERFCQFAEQQSDCLLVLVINRPASDPDQAWAKQLLDHPLLRQPAAWQSDNGLLSLQPLQQNSALLLVDRCVQGPPIPVKQGVGLARKIGADLLCALIAQQKVASPWIANSDADAQLPTHYFRALEQQQQADRISAVVFPYRHIFVDHTARLPTLLYEFSLHYYVEGLRFAASPYAYHTLGSTLCCHYQHYAMVRGFPKRAAAEDFYLLNKLAKTGSIHSLASPVIELQARQSSRVPFGTGPAVISLTANQQPLNMPLYHPDSFVYLRFMLRLLAQLAECEEDLASAATQLQTKPPQELDIACLVAIASAMGLPAAVAHSHRHGRSVATRQQQLQHWFDGFKTLKFIHQLRDQQLGTVSFAHWTEQSSAHSFNPSTQLAALLSQISSLS